jgi:hypothetical protein
MGVINAWDEASASCDHMPGPGKDGGHSLTVTATGSFTRDGCTTELGYHEPQGINPRDLILDVVLTEGESGPEVITPFEAHYPADGSGDRGDYDTVSFVVVGTDDAPPATPTVVEHVE